MESPTEGYELRTLDGDAEDISEHGRVLGVLAETMTTTADRLSELGDSSIYRSKATDKLSKTAAEIDEDMRAAATRYDLTGTVIETYGEALATAQAWINPNVETIRAAEEEYQAAKDALEDAQDAQSGLDRVWPWEDEPTDADRASAASAVSTAQTTLDEKETARNALWSTYETKFGDWSDAYDTAVEGIENAMETAGNNDGFWEAFDNFLDILGWVILVLSVVALIIGAPLTGLLAGIILALSALVVLGELLQFACGKATLSDVLLAGLALVPFGVGKLLSRGAPALSTVVQTARGSVTTAIRGGLPAMRFTTPFRNMSTAWSWLRAPATARGALPRPGLFTNPFTSLRMGGSQLTQVQTFINTMRSSPYASTLASLADDTARSLPGPLAQIGNILNFTGSSIYGASSASGVVPDIPWVNDITIDNGPVR